MKIKRFEASSMSDALRAVKKDFGDSAVILSAKTVKKSNRIFGGKRKNQVVVTAAIDRGAASVGGAPGLTGPAAETLTDGAAGRATTVVGRNDGFVPITRTGQKKLQSKFFRLAASETQRPEHPTVPEGKSLVQRLTDRGLEDWIAQDWSRQVRQLLSDSGDPFDDTEERNALSQVVAANHLAVPGSANKPRKVVLVGPSGSGKTTLAAKLAAAARLQSQSATVLSLDHFRIAGTEELVRYARIIDFNFSAPSGPEDIGSVLDDCQDDDLIVVDTPGFGWNDTATLKHVSDMACRIDGAEIHLLLNAGFQLPVMEAILDFFKPMGVQRLVFTHLDWVETPGPLFTMAMNAGLPVSYLSTGSEVPDGFQPATTERLVDLLLPETRSAREGNPVTVIRKTHGQTTHANFLANRNSDIFHRPDCRSVQRINNSNILMFENELDAMAQSFKPCRMCCHDLLVPKPINAMAYRPSARGRYN